jgi:hypothetical protein
MIPGLRLLEFRQMRKGALIGFAQLEYHGLIISDAAAFRKNGRSWVSLPPSPRVDTKTGTVLRKADGRPEYTSPLRWRGRALNDEFSAVVLAMIQRQFPDVLADEPRRSELALGAAPKNYALPNKRRASRTRTPHSGSYS